MPHKKLYFSCKNVWLRCEICGEIDFYLLLGDEEPPVKCKFCKYDNAAVPVPDDFWDNLEWLSEAGMSAIRFMRRHIGHFAEALCIIEEELGDDMPAGETPPDDLPPGSY
jgi:hypothetical protein